MLILTILAVILLAGMVVFVINVGDQTQRRTTLQHSADATAVAGAGWIARSLNTVAMNNVNMVRLLALINVLDAMPDAATFTLEEHRNELEAVQSINRADLDVWVRWQLDDVTEELNAEIGLLEEMRATLDDVDENTFYDAPGGRGRFWRAMEGMDALNQTTMQGLGEYAQLNAVGGGDVNLDREHPDHAAFIVPILPEVPWRRGEFDDFERPLVQGLLPDDVDDKEFNRGPFDTIFGWRRIIGGEQPGYWETISGGSAAPPSQGSGRVPIGRGAGGGGGGGARRRFVPTGEREPDAYVTYGFQPWMLDRVGSFASEHLARSRFMQWERRLAGYKLGYLFPGTGARFVIYPEFESDFDRAKEIAENDRRRIRETWFLAVEMKSRFKEGSAGFLSPGSYSFFVTSSQDDANTPRRVIVRGWMDPSTWNVPQVSDWAWRDEWEYTTYLDPTIGIGGVQDANGAFQPQTAYRYDTFIFVGVNIGEDYEIRNPHNFSGRSGLPAPTDLDHAQLDYADVEARRNFLNYLAIARVTDRASAWPSRFDGAKPYPQQVAVAQAHVFNNHSWDLWTQMWEAQLRPVGDYEHWIDRLEQAEPDAIHAVDQRDIDDLARYLRALREVHEAMNRDVLTY